MQLKSFKLKIFSIFLLPTIALIYFSFYFISIKYVEYKNASSNIVLAKMTTYTTELIHNLQIERGLSAGYIASVKVTKSDLLKQEKLTDKSFDEFINFFNSKFSNKDNFRCDKNKVLIKEVLKKWHLIKEIRKNILNKKIEFNKEIDYYSSINNILIKMIYVLTNMFGSDINAVDLYNLEQCKEHLGKERAYIYAAILSPEILTKNFVIIEKLILNRENFKEEFITKASIKDLNLYNKYVSLETEKKITKIEQLFLHLKLNKLSANEWWHVVTKQINSLDELSLNILNLYIKDMQNIVESSKIAFLNTIILWFISILAFLILMYVLNNLINKEIKLMNDLRITSYAFFDAYEAMLITDPNGKILKVNKAFENITGYTELEVIGKTPNILKSGKHSDEFYRDMWQALHTEGRWSGEVFNKRKNGEIYPERLSITAIKDNEGITTHYIAQFLDISDIKQAQEQIIHQATHDFLTDLPNRNHLFETLNKEISRTKRSDYIDAFLFVDLDGFKPINDKYGHAIGDKLLVEVAKRLKNSVRKEDYVARFGGDEFCVILVDFRKDDFVTGNIDKVANKILSNLFQPFYIDGNEIKVGASIGVRIFPKKDDTLKDIINDADEAMYQAKEGGKNKIVFFN